MQTEVPSHLTTAKGYVHVTAIPMQNHRKIREFPPGSCGLKKRGRIPWCFCCWSPRSRPPKTTRVLHAISSKRISRNATTDVRQDSSESMYDPMEWHRVFRATHSKVHKCCFCGCCCFGSSCAACWRPSTSASARSRWPVWCTPTGSSWTKLCFGSASCPHAGSTPFGCAFARHDARGAPPNACKKGRDGRVRSRHLLWPRQRRCLHMRHLPRHHSWGAWCHVRWRTSVLSFLSRLLACQPRDLPHVPARRLVAEHCAESFRGPPRPPSKSDVRPQSRRLPMARHAFWTERTSPAMLALILSARWNGVPQATASQGRGTARSNMRLPAWYATCGVRV